VGLVRTTDNFGATGEAPSHPKLLDWLAVRFTEIDWSHKKLIREIVLSRAYQMSSRPESAMPPPVSPAVAGRNEQRLDEPPIASALDPNNRLLAYQNRKRLDAECLRDAMLAVSGQLDLTRGGPAIRAKTDSEYGYKFDSVRRSVYSPIFRNNLPDIFDVFDFANPNTPTGRREVSTLPSQALYLMNSPFVMDAARQAAEGILELDLSDFDRIEHAYRGILGRGPTETECQLTLRYIQGFRSHKASDPSSRRSQAWAALFQVLMASVDFRYLY
jgi:hypothetical protein